MSWEDDRDRRIIDALFSPPADSPVRCGVCGAEAVGPFCPGCGAGVASFDWEGDVVADFARRSWIEACRTRGLIRRDAAWTLPEPTTNDAAAEIAEIVVAAILDGPAQ